MTSVLKMDRIDKFLPGAKNLARGFFWWFLIVWNSRPNLKSRLQSEISAENWKSQIFQFRLKFQTIGVRRYTYPPEKKRSTNSSFLRCGRRCYLVTWSILKLLLGLAGWPALFKKRVFLTLNSGLQSTCLTDRLLREMDPIWTACRLRSNQSIGQFHAKSGKWKLVCSHKKLILKVSKSTSTPASFSEVL